MGLISQSNETAVGIDLFEDMQLANLDASGSGSKSAVLKNIEKYAPDSKFELISANSFSLTEKIFIDGRLARIFHIDGGHFKECVANDLHISQLSLHLGGVIIVDDYWHSGFPEVQEAVNRYYRTSNNIKAVPFAVGKNKISLAGHEIKDKLLSALKEKFPPQKTKSVKVLGYDAIRVDQH